MTKPVDLDFRSFEQAIEYVRQLHTLGYTSTGQWNLAQSCFHLAEGIDKTITGFDVKVPLHIKLVARYILRPKIFKTRIIPKNLPAPRQLQPDPNLDEAQTIAHFEQSALKIRDYDGPLQPHFAFGPMTTEQWKEFHLIHCIHHLGYLYVKI